MPRVSVFKTNFTAGELSPRLLARVDIARYQNGAKEIFNGYPLVHGGARRRAGLRFAAAAKNATKRARLVPFIRDRENAFMLEFGETYIRFYTGLGQIEASPGVPFEIASPWDDLELADVHYVQGADTMFFSHPSYSIRTLKRFSDTLWKLQEVDWEVPPSEEIGDRPQTTLTLSATSGAAVTATAGAASFLASDVGRAIESVAGRGIITVFTSTTVVTVNIAAADAFASTGPIAANSWKITESPKTTCTPSASGPIGVACTLTLGANGWRNDAQVSHIGSFVEVNGGLVEITAVATAVSASGIVRSALEATTQAESGAWAVRQVAWNPIDGFPRAVSLFEQRLVTGGSPAFPNTVWGTKTGEFFNFAAGVNDSDGFTFNLASDQVNPIEHLASTRVLQPLTFGGEFSMTGGTEKPLTPTNVQVRLQTTYGAAVCRPVRVGNEVIFVQRGGRKLRALGYRVETDSFNAPDISILAEHITEGGIEEMAYAQEPDQVVWMVRGDGRMVSMSIDRDQDAIGFASSQTDGVVESAASMPFGTEDQTWWAVKRTVNGAEKRYIEFFEEGRNTDSCITGAVDEDAIVSATWLAGVVTVTQIAHGYLTGDTIRLSGFTPSGYNGEHEITMTGANTYTFALSTNPGATTVVGTAAKAVVTWAGFNHLEAKTLDIVADGYVAASKTVVGGSITLDKPVYAIEGGLHYTSRVVTLPPEFGTGQGSAQGNAMSIHEIVVRFYKTKGGTVNGQPLTSRKFGTFPVLNQPVPEFTGDKRVENLGWGRAGSGDSDGTVTIEQPQPLPMQIIGLVTRLTANDG